MRNRDAALRRQEIMQTALKMFIEKGYEKTTTNDILKALNLSRGGLYHHFESKEAILDAAIKELFLSEINRITTMIDSDSISAPEKLKYLIETESPTQPMLEEVKNIVLTRYNPTLIMHLLKIKLEVITPLFTKIIEQGIGEGVFDCKYPEEVSKISIILSTLLFTDTMISMTVEEADRMITVFQNAAEAMVGAKPGTFDFMKQSIEIGK